MLLAAFTLFVLPLFSRHFAIPYPSFTSVRCLFCSLSSFASLDLFPFLSQSLSEWCAQNRLFHVSPLQPLVPYPSSIPVCGLFSFPSLSGAHKTARFMSHHSTPLFHTPLPDPSAASFPFPF